MTDAYDRLGHEQDDEYPPPLDFESLRSANVNRCTESDHDLDDWSPTDWACALAGEVGEACNLVKKLRRLGLHAVDNPTSDEMNNQASAFVTAIAAELADAVIYADLLAARLDVDLGQAVKQKFNETSRLLGSRFVL